MRGNYDFTTGLLTSFADANGNASNYGYDFMSRLTLSSYLPNPARQFFTGVAAGILTSPYVTLYSYDALGNLLNANQTGDGSHFGEGPDSYLRFVVVPTEG